MKFTTGATLALAFLFASTTHARVVRTVALTGTAAPGTSGASFEKLTPTNFTPVLDDFGRVGFAAQLATGGSGGVTDANNTGIWWDAPNGELGLVAREGDVAPSAGTAKFGDFMTPLGVSTYPVMNGDGNLTFAAAAGTKSGVWRADSNGLAAVAISGSLAPGIPGASLTYIGLFAPAIDSHGGVAFSAFTSGPYFNGNWLQRGSDAPELIARAGETAPGTGGASFSNVLFPLVADNGDVMFRGALALDSAGVTADNWEGVWRRKQGGSLELMLRLGDAAVDVPGGVFHDFQARTPVMNNLGDISYFGLMKPGLGGVTEANDLAIWSTASQPHLVAREGAVAPGAGGDTFASFTSWSLDDLGRVMFSAVLSNDGGNSYSKGGLWRENGSGQLECIFVSGDSAPGTGNVFTEVDMTATNSTGEFVVRGRAGGSRGIWIADSTGTLDLVVREGELFDVDGGPGVELRTVSQMDFLFSSSSNNGGQPFGFNDRADLAFYLQFSDGSEGVFVSSIVPEASSAALLATGLMAAGTLFRRYAK